MHRMDMLEDGEGSLGAISLNGGNNRRFREGSGDSTSHQNQNQTQHGNHSSGSSVDGNHKTGRKGDPRMHRAVSARLSDPNISLFDALKVGGFEYENDNDANAVDSEHIALGQRKNQLSRRVRLARQQKHEDDFCTSSYCIDESEKDTVTRPSTRVLKSPGAANRRNKRSFRMTEGDGGLSEDPAAKLPDVQKEEATAQVEQPSIMAKNHPSYHPILWQQRISPMNGNELIGGYVLNPLYPSGVAIPLHNNNQQGEAVMRNVNVDASVQVQQQQLVPAVYGLSQTCGTMLHHQVQQPGVFYVAASPQIQQGLQNTSNTATDASSHSVLLQPSQTSPPHEKHHQAPTGLTISSLNKTAVSIGMTLEQFAVALENCKKLSQILESSDGHTPTKSQKELAITLYQAENRALYQKSMLLAGYSPEIALDERSPQHFQMATAAWNAEGERLTRLINQDTQDLIDPPLEVNAPTNGDGSNGGANSSWKAGPSNNELDVQDCAHGHNHQHSAVDSTNHGAGSGECVFEGGRHIHRLEGACGHKAILHQPTDGKAHIDFVIGNRIECYQGMKPLSSRVSQDKDSNIKFWPSHFKCKDLSCKDKCIDPSVACKADDHRVPDCKVAGEPKVFELEDIDFDSEEWNLEFGNEETLLGLFKLGESKVKTAVISDPVSPVATLKPETVANWSNES